MDKSAIKHMTQGGQILLHELHMVGQVLYKLLVWLLPVGLLITFGSFIVMTRPYQRYMSAQWCWAKVFIFADNAQHQQIWLQPNGRPIRLYSTQILQAPFMQENNARIFQKARISAQIGLGGYVSSVLFIALWLQQRGKKQIAQKRIKGDHLDTVAQVKQLILKSAGFSYLVVGNEHLPLPKGCEMQHFLFHGTTGSGKSTAIKSFLDQIRAQGERAIVYDKSCNLVEQFYQPEQDQLMNPLDVRSCSWSLWQECRDKTDFDNLAAALIPMPPGTQDPFWVNAARTIFSAAAYRLEQDPGQIPTAKQLLRHLLTAELSELQPLLKGTEAETLISEKAEKTAISIKAVLATYLKSLCYIKEDEAPFSIRQWIQDEASAHWLFMSSLGDKHESLKPLMTAWLDIAINALLSLQPNSDRRIWVILDELTSLQQLPYLTAALSEGRKFGGCFAIGIQSYAQLAKVYGHEGAREISSLLNTRFMFRVPDPDIAYWSAKNLGDTTLQEVREGITYGANSARDGVSIQYAEREKPVVTSSEILQLKDLSCYVRLAGGYPITQLHFAYASRPSLNVPFQARILAQDSLNQEIPQTADTAPQQAAVASSDQSEVDENKAEGAILAPTTREIVIDESMFH